VGFFGNSMLVRADADVTALDILRDAGGEPDGGWVGRAVPYLLRWAGESADEALLRATVQGSLTFAEDSVVRLAAAVGAIAPSDLEDYMFGSIEDVST
jgi:hypothetical protein